MSEVKCKIKACGMEKALGIKQRRKNYPNAHLLGVVKFIAQLIRLRLLLIQV